MSEEEKSIQQRNKEHYYDKAKQKIAEQPDLVFIEDLCIEIGIHKSTFYKYFPIGSDDNNAINDLLEENSAKIKRKLRKQWEKGENFSAQMAAYKLISNDKEFEKLTGVITKNENKNENIGEIKITIIPSQGDE